MKKKCALILMVLLLVLAVGFASSALAEEIALYLDSTNLTYLANVKHSVRVTSKTAVSSDLPFTLTHDGRVYSGVILAGEKEAFVDIEIESQEPFSKTSVSINKGDGYRVSTSRGKAEITIIPDPELTAAQGGLSVAIAGTNTRVSFTMENYGVLSGSLMLELRDAEGNVLDKRAFSRSEKTLTYKFLVPEDWTGSNYVALWYEDRKLSADYNVVIKQELSAVYSVDTERRAVAITVDCGSGNAKKTRAWMDLMDEYGVKATFFVTGKFASKNQAVLQEILDRGHEIGNHSYNHVPMGGMTHDEVLAEILPTNQIIYEATNGYVPKYFRAPGGKWSYGLHTQLQTLGLTMMQWTFSSGDSSPTITPERILYNVAREERLQPGAIYLFHNNTPCFDIMDDVFEFYRQNGYEMVSLSELLPDGEYVIDKDGVVHAAE
ncbi:MAG: polysaccharide deacetylase family protein [Clostridia bacterium]|nr:polysaccharide deacetylase family protein [Clostridia bacterium]